MRVNYPAAVLAFARDIIYLQAGALVHGPLARPQLVRKSASVPPDAAVNYYVARNGVLAHVALAPLSYLVQRRQRRVVARLRRPRLQRVARRSVFVPREEGGGQPVGFHERRAAVPAAAHLHGYARRRKLVYVPVHRPWRNFKLFGYLPCRNFAPGYQSGQNFYHYPVFQSPVLHIICQGCTPGRQAAAVRPKHTVF